MPKIKKSDPFFLKFINLPIIDLKNDNSIDILNSILNDKFKLPDDWDQSENGNRIEWGNKDRIEKLFKQLLKKGNLPSDHARKLKKVIERLNRRFDNDDVEIIGKEWIHFRAIIHSLISDPPGPGSWSGIRLMNEYITTLRHTEPTVRWKDAGGFEIALMPDSTHFYAPSEISDLFGFLGIEIVQFLVDHYKLGIFAYCKLEGCEQIIITTNGRKYCCRYHGQKASNEAKRKDLDYTEYKRIRNKLYKRYKRHPSHQIWDFEEYLQKEWDPHRIDLYHHFSHSPKK